MVIFPTQMTVETHYFLSSELHDCIHATTGHYHLISMTVVNHETL